MKRLAGLLDPLDRRQRLIENHAAVDELDVVQMQHVQVVGLQPLQALLDAALDACSRKVELGGAVAPALGRQYSLAPPPDQCLPQARL